MPINENFLEQLVPAGDAFELLARAYDRHSGGGEFKACQERAVDALARRLSDGVLKAWATRCTIDSSRDTTPHQGGQIIATYDFHHSDGIALVPNEFWSHFQSAQGEVRRFDPVTGEFTFHYNDFAYSRRFGSAYDVHFESDGLPQVAAPTSNWSHPSIETVERPGDEKPAKKEKRGRKPAPWWADFAEELVVHIHENGFPESRDALFNAVSESLAAQGRKEPGSTAGKDVISNIWARLGIS